LNVPPDRLLTVHDVSERLRLHPITLYRLVRKGRIPFIRKQGLGIRFRKDEIDEWLAQGAFRPSPIQEAGRQIDLLSENYVKMPNRGGLGEMAKAKLKTRLNFGYGAIYGRETKSGIVRWYIDYRDAKGKRVQKLAVHASSQEEAKQALDFEVLRARNRACGIELHDEGTLFGQLSKMYLEDYAKHNKTSWKDDQYRLDANMVPFFGKWLVVDISPQHIERYKGHRLGEDVSRSTINRELTILKKMFNLAIDWGLTTNNPVRRVKLFSEKDTQKERILTPEEEARLLEQSPDYLRPILMMALDTGMRRGEILRLRWEDVDLKVKQIAVKHTKNGKDRFVPINARLLAVLSLLGPPRGKSGFVFPNPATGKPYTEVKKSFKRACDRAGIKGLRFHDLRHTFASRLVEVGVDIVTIRDLLGHFSIKVTQRYTHSGKNQKAAAVELLAQKSPQNWGNLLHPCYTN
jgi:excisionase family DNA binding protein